MKKLTIILCIFLLAGISGQSQQFTSPELVFKNATLSSGTAGANDAVYRFPLVRTNVDALVKIKSRSSSRVKLKSVDLTDLGHSKAFQPQITYDDDEVPGAVNYWMEFEISFVQPGKTTPVIVNNFDVTALDIDGNGDRINEYVSFYEPKSYVIENNSSLDVTSIWEIVNNVNTNIGRRFEGPKKNYENIDTGATKVMVTTKYQSRNSFRLRIGAEASGANAAADRMYSFWFKGFSYTSPVESTLPVTLINWTAIANNNNVNLKWTTTVEKNSSHFTIERSTDGIEYTDAAILFAQGNSDINHDYAFTDKLPAANTGIVYYRLRMADLDGKYKTSIVKVVRLGKTDDAVKILAYPNPVTNDVRITIPQQWQDKTVSYQLYNSFGQAIRTYTVQRASQTEVMTMAQVPAGIYLVKVSNGTEIATQTIVKAKQ